jgi:uncharacterized protein YeaO (DUF488 family)
MAIKVRRVYDRPARSDGFRVLVDRVRPRGVRKEDVKIDEWLTTVAPSTELRKWFGHDSDTWNEFKRRYFKELKSHEDELAPLREKVTDGPLTLIFSAKDEQFNNAVALKEYLESHRNRFIRTLSRLALHRSGWGADSRGHDYG